MSGGRSNVTTRTINNSEIQSFKRCRRKWDLSYRQGLYRPEDGEKGNLGIGTAVHTLLEAYYKDQPEPEWESRLPDPKERELVKIMYSGYLRWLETTGADNGLTVVASEQQVSHSLGVIRGREVILTGRLDLRVIDEYERTLLFDHKTCQSFERTAEGIQHNEQLLTYAMLLKLSEGITVDGALLNMLRKVKRGPTAKPPFYQRETVTFNEHQLKAHWEHTVGIVEEILRAEERIDAGVSTQMVCPPTFDSTCSWMCPFMAVCSLHDNGSNVQQALQDFYTVKPAA
jgi:hypothetical protein